MKTSSIRIEGNIISPELFGKLDTNEIFGQNASDFGFDRGTKIRDNIARAWADAKDQWNIFKRRVESLPDTDSGTEETRKYWILPLLENLGYTVSFQRSADVVNDKTYHLSHRAENLDGFPIHIMGINDSLDKRRETGGPRMSPHALLQDYLNVTEHLFGLVTNGFFLRVLRDSGKLVRLTYLEFNLQRMLEDDLYAEFSIMYRLIHASRMPRKQTETQESIIEKYHQDAIESGARIRDNLSGAVEKSILTVANGFLQHPSNDELRNAVIAGSVPPEKFFQYMLRFIYRLLFLMVIEERDIVFPEKPNETIQEWEKLKRYKDIYFNNYSLSRLRKLAEKIYFFDDKLDDLWSGLKSTFAIFEQEHIARKLALYPLGGDLFSPGSIGELSTSALSNKSLLECVRNLSLFENPDGKGTTRVNYAALNVEEFGSVYEGLLEYNGRFIIDRTSVAFAFAKSSERSSSGSHYTPEELVQPLIKHSLDYIIEERLKVALKYSIEELEFGGDGLIEPKYLMKENELGIKYFAEVSIIIAKAYISGNWRGDENFISFAWGDAEFKPLYSRGRIDYNKLKDVGKWWNELHQAVKQKILASNLLLFIKVCDVACGSGHILLSAARRIAIELARVRTGEEQPSPAPYRAAMRDVINHCIYGVDKNPLAVELCKIALWLESYNAGMPLSFLDHRIKCGDSIVGLARKEELFKDIPETAFKKLPGDEPEVVKELLKKQRNEVKGTPDVFNSKEVTGTINEISLYYNGLDEMPETTLEDVRKKAERYNTLQDSEWCKLKEAADLRTAQFFIPKTRENCERIATNSDYIKAFTKEKAHVRNKIAYAMAVAAERRFFHWFLEFPEIMEQGGFDCILGNPPFLGGQKLSGSFGDNFLNYVKTIYAPAGSCDLVTYFFRRIFSILKSGGFQSLISTNTIAQGNAREGGLDVIMAQGGSINFAIRSMKWPGLAAVEVALIAIHKGSWNKKYFLGQNEVRFISSYLDDTKDLGNPFTLKQNEGKSFQGSIVLGKGFILQPEEAAELIKKNPKNKDVLFPYLNGEDLNSDPEQKPSRWVINFFDWKEEYCRKNYPDCFEIVEKLVKPERLLNNDKGAREKWWQFLRPRGELYSNIKSMDKVLVIAQVSKTVGFCFTTTDQVISMMCIVLKYNSFDQFSILQSSFHKEWIHKYGSALKSDVRYTPSDIFENYPFPQKVDDGTAEVLEVKGGQYYELRECFMRKNNLGLTKTYNLFHNNSLELNTHQPSDVNQVFISEKIINDIKNLRELHKQMDESVLNAYGWEDINLVHDFYEVDYLPENDRVRYTISPEARKEILRRLLELNHKIHDEEVKAGLWDKKKPAKKLATGSSNIKKNDSQGGLFD